MMKKTEFILFGRLFAFNPLLFCLFLLLLILLCSLGAWQLRRADEKAQLLAQRQQANEQQAVTLNAMSNPHLSMLEYRQATVSGRFDSEHQILLDNQVKNGKAGFFVLTPLMLTGSSQSVLVNRGWVPMKANRTSAVDITVPETIQTLAGRINHFPAVGIQLAAADVPGESWPVLVQIVNTTLLARKLGYSLFDFQIEMNADMANGFDRTWSEVKIMPPEQHVAYAVQWFGLALTLSILFVWLSIKR